MGWLVILKKIYILLQEQRSLAISVLQANLLDEKLSSGKGAHVYCLLASLQPQYISLDLLRYFIKQSNKIEFRVEAVYLIFMSIKIFIEEVL